VWKRTTRLLLLTSVLTLYVWNGHSLRQAQGRLCPLPLTLPLIFDPTERAAQTYSNPTTTATSNPE